MHRKKQRNVVFEIIKIYLSFVILVYHYNIFFCDNTNPLLFRGGYIAVDVFFAISGYFLFFTFHRNAHIRPFLIMFSKMKKMWPDYLICLACSVVAWFLLKGLTQSDIFQIIKEILYVQEWIPPSRTMINGPTWYISAMFFCTFVFAFLYRFIPEKYCLFILGVLLTFGISIMWFQYGTIRIHGNFFYFIFSSGVIRGFVGMIIGLLIGHLDKDNYFGKKRFAWIPFFIGFVGVSIFFFIAGVNRHDILCLPFIALFIIGAVMLSKKQMAVPSTIIWLLSDLSLHIYLLQRAWQMICLRFFKNIPVPTYIIVLLIACLLWFGIKYTFKFVIGQKQKNNVSK